MKSEIQNHKVFAGCDRLIELAAAAGFASDEMVKKEPYRYNVLSSQQITR